MGADGGSTTSRADMVRTKGYGSSQKSSQGGMGYNANGIVRIAEETVSLAEQRRLKMSTCALTNRPLEKPVVACRLGNLYNKAALLESIVSRSLPEPFSYIQSLKDIVELKSLVLSSGHPMCALTNKVLDDGSTRSVVLWSCGCLLSQKAFDSLSDSLNCMRCGNPFTRKDVIKIFPDNYVTLKKELLLSKKVKTNKPEPLGSLKALKEAKRKQQTEETIAKFRKTEAYDKIFKSESPPITDAFGREFCNKGSGI